MNYNKFCQHEAPLLMLKKQEIEHPYLVLDDLCKKRREEVFRVELQQILSMIFKPGEWKKHDPGMLFETYKDVVRLVDVLYLINKYSPVLNTAKPRQDSSGRSSPRMVNLNSMFMHSPKRATSPVREEEVQTVLGSFYSTVPVAFLKIDLNCYLQAALDASYMENDRNEYFGFDQSHLLIEFGYLDDLIREAYVIHAKGAMVFPVLESCPELAFAIDKSHPTHLFAECISRPMEVVRFFYDHYLRIDHLNKGMKVWKRMLYGLNFWKEEDNPGNLIYLHNRIITLIDACWLANKKGQLDTISFDYSRCNKACRSIIKKCDKEERRFPVWVIRNFFASKSLHEWKGLLDEWLECSLSNRSAYDEARKSEIGKDFRNLIKFMEAVYLINLPQQ